MKGSRIDCSLGSVKNCDCAIWVEKMANSWAPKKILVTALTVVICRIQDFNVFFNESMYFMYLIFLWSLGSFIRRWRYSLLSVPKSICLCAFFQTIYRVHIWIHCNGPRRSSDEHFDSLLDSNFSIWIGTNIPLWALNTYIQVLILVRFVKYTISNSSFKQNKSKINRCTLSFSIVLKNWKKCRSFRGTR